MTLSIRERSQKVAACITENVGQTLRGITATTGISKSSVHRYRQAIERRNQYAESSLWETAAGSQWLIRLVIGLVYYFGIKQGVGAESLSEFICAIHLDTHVASSASALRQLKQRVNQAIIDYEKAQAEHCVPAEGQGICVGADETFFGLPVLVLLELSSGYIFIETECENRTYATWMEQVNQWWQDSPWQCHYLVSDGARALVKLAVSGLGCVSVADLFHALRALGRPIGRALGQQAATLKKQQDKLRQQLNKPRKGADKQALQTLIEHNEAALQQVQQDEKTYQEALEEVSQTIHPFTLDSLQWQTQRALLTHLAPPLQCLWDLAPTYGAQKAQQAIDTFEAQITSFTQAIEAWQQWVTSALDGQTQDAKIRSWVLTSLLPWVYWTQQADKTRQPSLKRRYQDAASHAFDQLFEQDITLTLADHQRQRWVLWCREFCAKYQRTSSAVEGRNGYLSKLHHARRGFSEQSLNVLTIIHNFDLQRYDGTTAAQRLFGHEFPDPFEWMLAHVGELPMPRRSAKLQQPKPLCAGGVPA
ncbi:DNA-binding protein [cf. Phormidesmis sp. LEGE 11477]|nr:DNA-binding protein [cf. Phormidesmis sp. LEGE 11477]